MQNYTENKMIIPFTHLDRSGEVLVRYDPIQDPVVAGFDQFHGPYFDMHKSIGYPMMHASIHQYAGTGVRAFMGWIQIIRDTFNEGKDSQRVEVDVDVSPDMRRCGVPFYSYGMLPQIFDAPNNNVGNETSLRWVEDTYLTSMPNGKHPAITFILGFRWGYVEYHETENKPVEILPLQRLDQRNWLEDLPLLRENFPSWNFAG
ncbi:MAG: hypothetical protein HY835_01760 [Anaerolineae bacterium]|nr:hypothetical protein [Anaerolineae bacterium]